MGIYQLIRAHTYSEYTRNNLPIRADNIICIYSVASSNLMSRTHSRLRKFLPLKHDSQLARRTVSQFVQSSPQQRREVQVWKNYKCVGRRVWAKQVQSERRCVERKSRILLESKKKLDLNNWWIDEQTSCWPSREKFSGSNYSTLEAGLTTTCVPIRRVA